MLVVGVRFLEPEFYKMVELLSTTPVSSIWSSIKGKCSTITQNYSWLIGNRTDVNFWIDVWCGPHVASRYNIQFIISSIADCWKVIDRGWCLQCKVFIMVGIQICIEKIWLSRNSERFEDTAIDWKSCTRNIASMVNLGWE